MSEGPKVLKHDKSRLIKAEIQLPVSKSIANRELIIQALAGGTVDDVSAAGMPDDVHLLIKCLQGDSPEMYAGDAGTAARFLCAYLSVQDGKQHLITASDRMKQRPMRILVDALTELGADIRYFDRKGYLPMIIKGKKLRGGRIQINAAVSSQFISALLMIAPLMENGLHLELEGEISSGPYIRMTLEIMQRHGIEYRYEGCDIFIGPQQYVMGPVQLEKDWSAASYWYEMAAFSEECEILLKGLKKESLQGDAEIQNIMKQFGVNSEFRSEGVMLRKSRPAVTYFTYDFISCPDLAQTVAATCAGLGIPARLTGLHSLRIKETDRIHALEQELGKIGAAIIAGNDFIEIKPQSLKSAMINTYGDHRMAMAFAPLAILKDGMQIESPNLVSKSFPAFWKELEKAGVKSIN